MANSSKQRTFRLKKSREACLGDPLKDRVEIESVLQAILLAAGGPVVWPHAD